MIRRAFLAAALAIVACAACDRNEPDAVPNVRLGMAPRDVRDRFEPGGDGTWRTSASAGDDTAIEWRAANGSAKVKDARFEFHLGMLVAIRATTADPPPAGERITTTPKTVTVRRAAPAAEGGGTQVAVLARDCPTHKDEAEGLVSKVK